MADFRLAMEMIKADLTEIFRHYGEWDFIVRRKYLNYAAKLMQQHQTVVYRDTEYHNAEDLKVDLYAECYEQEEI